MHRAHPGGLMLDRLKIVRIDNARSPLAAIRPALIF
jgi:hypothetical protein